LTEISEKTAIGKSLLAGGKTQLKENVVDWRAIGHI
jgi:hypothetical protein